MTILNREILARAFPDQPRIRAAFEQLEALILASAGGLENGDARLTAAESALDGVLTGLDQRQPLSETLTGLSDLPLFPGAVEQLGAGSFAVRTIDADDSASLLTRGIADTRYLGAADVSTGVSDGDKGDIVITGGVWAFDTGVVTTFARTFLDDANAGAVRTTLGAEATIAAGTTAQYWRGDKSWQTLNGLAVANTPAGNIAATTVQAAINELDTEKLAASSYTAADVLSKLLTVDGAGSGLDADLLDGNSSAYFLAAASYTAADVLAKLVTVDGAGSGLDADLLDGQSSAFYLARANHTGTQLAATVSDFTEAAQDAAGAMVDSSLVYVDATPLLTRAALTGDATAAQGSNAVTVVRINGVSLAGLGTGILKNTTGTGVPSIAVAGDFPTLNQNTTGSAATLTTSRNFSISGGGITAATVGFNGSAAVVLNASVDAGHITLARMADVANGTVFYRKTAGTGAPEVQTLATLKADLGLTGTNSGDQTTIVGITGTKAQFDTAVSDGNIVYTDAIGVSVQAFDADLTTWAGITPGTGVGAALAINVGSAGAFVTFNGAGGTPSSLTLTNATGLPIAGLVNSTSAALGLGSIELGDASDTTITRTGAGDIAVEGNVVYRAGGTDVALADGGTGASLTDPNADRVMFWDDSAGAVTWLTMGTGLTITGTTLDASGGGVTPAALTKADDTNVTLTLGGTPATALLQAASITVGWTGTLAVARGGTGSGTAAGAATNLGLGTGDSPQFTGVNIGHASDTTLARSSAGNLTIEGNLIYRAGGADVPVTDGGTGASDAATARTNLGLVIGTNVQAFNSNLATIAGLTATTDNFIVSVASAWASRTPAQVRTTLGLVIGTNVQAWDADLDAVASSGIASAWTGYTPSVSANSGSFTTVATEGRYKQVGKTVFFWARVAITTNGTAAGFVNIGLPVAAAAVGSGKFQFAVGMETDVTGNLLRGAIGTGASTVGVKNYDNTYPGANGHVLVMEGVYEAS